MLFLLNDTILDLDPVSLATDAIAAHVHALPTQRVIDLIGEAMSKTPNFARAAPVAACKAAFMLVLKQPELNAALFLPVVAPDGSARFASRFAALDPPVLFELKGLQDQGRLTSGIANAYVWTPATAPATE